MEKQFKISIIGDSVSPENLSYKALVKILDNYVDALYELSKSRNSALNKKKLDFTLTDIQSGSYEITMTDNYGCDLSESQIELADFLEADRFEQLPDKSIQCLRSMADDLDGYNWQLTLFAKSNKKVTFLPKKFIVKTETYKEETTIYGTLIQIGGRKPNIHLEIPGRSNLLICDINESMAKELALKLYTEIGLSGIADRYINSTEIKRFKVVEILPYDPSSYDENINRLRELFGEIHTDLSPDEYFAKLREDY